MDYTLEQLKYPIGKFIKPDLISAGQIAQWIEEIASLPSRLTASVASLSDQQLDTPYRESGWTLRQVVHHVADSHMNAYVRIKLMVTEDQPTIKPYMEDRWANCDEARNAPVSVSLDILEALHYRWVLFLRSLNEGDMESTYFHPDNQKVYVLKDVIGLYAWHGNHHLNHIIQTKNRFGW